MFSVKFTLTIPGKDKHATVKPQQHYHGCIFPNKMPVNFEGLFQFSVSSELLIWFGTEDIQELYNWLFCFYTLCRLLATTGTEEIQKKI